MRFKYILAFTLIFYACFPARAQISLGDTLTEIDYSVIREYEIGGITVSGVQFLDNNVLIQLSGLFVGQKIKVPGEAIKKAIEKLWDQGLFENIRISATRIEASMIFLDINLKERPRLSKFSFEGVRKSEADNLRDEIKLLSGDVITDNTIIRTSNSIKNYFIKKGFFNTEVNIRQIRDTTRANNVILTIRINKHSRVRINEITIRNNQFVALEKLKKSFKETKEKGVVDPFAIIDNSLILTAQAVSRFSFSNYINDLKTNFEKHFRLRIFKGSKFIEEDYSADKVKLIDKYNELGYRDAKILKDSIYKVDNKTINIEITVDEGRKYYFRTIKWVGNTKYPDKTLDAILKIKKGDVYNQKLLETNLSFNPDAFDVSSLYLDDGYLFFQAVPVEVLVENDSIDLEIRIHEGKQATISKVTVSGNTKTNDHVVIREIRTKPGQLFSRSDIMRTTRELAQLRYFDQEKIVPDIQPNPLDGTVDIAYKVEETSADQVEMSGGWGYGKVIGSLGLSFNNFSLRNILKRSEWRPVPTGDGQKLSLRLQSYGKGYISYTTSFTEPWLGGKKPNAFSVTYYHSLYSNGLEKSDASYYSLVTNAFSIGLGKRLAWPDDFFSIYHGINFTNYKLHNYTLISNFNNGYSNSVAYSLSFSRNSVDAPIYPRTGSEVSVTVAATPPYSLFSDKDYTTMSDNEKYRWNEYHKWKFASTYFVKIVGDLVLQSRAKFGFLGAYNSDIGVTPFERFYLGGNGLSGISNIDGREVIGMRGYSDLSLTPDYYKSNNIGGTIYDKFTLELRYPVSLNPSATIYGLAFLEAGNAFLKFRNFSPFDVKKSAGLGVRIFLPMFGILGLDWGYGFDDIYGMPSANKSNFHFSINQSID